MPNTNNTSNAEYETIGELYSSKELYNEVELTSTIFDVVINPKNVIRVSRSTKIIRIR